MSKSFYIIAGFLLVLIPLAFFIMPSDGFEGDLMCWVRWAHSIQLTGLGNAYSNPEIVYHPFFLEILYIYGKIFTTENLLIENLHILKAMIFVFDIAGVLTLAWFLDKKKIASWKALIILFCPAYFYNTICWGQVDTIHTAFCFLSVILIFNKKYLPALVFYILALSMKFQAIIFAPILMLLTLPYIIESKNNFIKSSTVIIFSLVIILFPFILKNQVKEFLHVTTVAVNYFPVVSMNAYNVWYLIFPRTYLMGFPDTQLFLGMSYKNWGHIFFFAGILITLFPLCAMLKKLFKEKSKYIFTENDIQMILIYCALVPLFFFFFNTQMHERYAHPTILFAGAFAVISGRYLFFALFSFAYFFNLDRLIHYSHLPAGWYKNSFLYNQQFIALVYLAALICGIWLLFNIYKKDKILSSGKREVSLN